MKTHNLKLNIYPQWLGNKERVCCSGNQGGKIMKRSERKILFRGKRADNNEWVEGDYFHDPDLGSRISGFWYYSSGEGLQRELYDHEVILDTVGQYTGLTDENGKKIFEGDIVKLVNHQKGTIAFESGAFGIIMANNIDYDYLDSKIKIITGCDNLPRFCYSDNFVSLLELMLNYNQEDSCCSVVEVIGNIHDNPELLQNRMDGDSK